MTVRLEKIPQVPEGLPRRCRLRGWGWRRRLGAAAAGPGASMSAWSQQSGAESLLLLPLLLPPPPPPPPPLPGSMIGGAVCVVKRGREMEAGETSRAGAGRNDPAKRRGRGAGG